MFHTVISYILLVALVATFIIKNEKRKLVVATDNTLLSPEYSNALKGFFAIVIICHHWCLYNLHLYDVSGLFGALSVPILLAGNVSLVVFLFLSGYGICMSEQKKSNSIQSYAKKRLWKIYKHCFILYLIAFVAYFLFGPGKLSEELMHVGWLNGPFLSSISAHEIDAPLIWNWFFGKMDWYVWTTLVLYVLFYIAFHFSKKFFPQKAKLATLLTLFLLIAVYYLFVYFGYDRADSRYCRNLWAFYFGVIFAFDSRAWKNVFCYLPLAISLSLNLKTEDSWYTIASVISIVLIVFVVLFNRKYNINSRLFVVLGIISYPLYLIHRMWYHLLWSWDLLFFPFFLILTIGSAFVYVLIEKRLGNCRKQAKTLNNL